ncbi:MAG TPA: ATP-binding cassette domain-containing protein [Pararhizobium sp.]|nr:ATP-binding cassette domain-containing protein [Pararhizobium sp.]
MPAREKRLSADSVILKEDRPPLDIEFRSGEIVGLAGLDGHGQDAFMEVLAGWTKPVSGSVSLFGEKDRLHIRGFAHAMRHGVAYLPRDRRKTGIFPALSILDNFAIASIGGDTRFGFISGRSRRQRYEKFKALLSIVADDPKAAIPTLSGGNQQKVLLARLLVREPAVLLLNDPTRGVDVATRRLLYKVFRELAAEGMTIVTLSTEIEEAIFLCDRVLVFRDNALSAELSGDGLTNDHVIAAMFGQIS